jgi:hypothetical protein
MLVLVQGNNLANTPVTAAGLGARKQSRKRVFNSLLSFLCDPAGLIVPEIETFYEDAGLFGEFRKLNLNRQVQADSVIASGVTMSGCDPTLISPQDSASQCKKQDLRSQKVLSEKSQNI